MQMYTSSKGRFAERYRKNAAHGSDGRTLGGFKASPGGLRREVRMALAREVRVQPKAEPNMPIRPLASNARIFVTPAFTCPKGCKCVGRCPAIEARESA